MKSTAQSAWIPSLAFAFWFVGAASVAVIAQDVRVSVFDVDASPPIGGPLAYDPCVEITDPLSCRGIVLTGAGDPIVLVAIDWLGVANEARSYFQTAIAKAVKTQPDRVAIHAIHQHDAPRCDFTSAALLAHHGADASVYDVPFARDVFQQVAKAAADSIGQSVPVAAVATATEEVQKIASNRRLLGTDGTVKFTRYTACKDENIRAMPTGTIDPNLRMIGLYETAESAKPFVVLTYYATHPQSFYRTGQANPDFPGYARNARQASTGVPHIHFNGAGGNIGAGKWNDGSPENRPVLAARLAEAMQQAFDKLDPRPVADSDVSMKVHTVQLPPGDHVREEALIPILESKQAKPVDQLTAAKHLAYLRQCQLGHPIVLQCLKIGPARVLHMPGELFVEYQLAASAMRPEQFVAMAAYGEYGTGYIGTEIAYSQGGYETSDRASRVSPASEAILIGGIKTLLEQTD